jgi:radical SAM protein with 4Fe4S-binding SPASM domain
MKLKNSQLIIETTNICNAHCVTCPREQFTQKPTIMTMKLFNKIINDASNYDIQSLDCCGFGDCFLDTKLFKRFEYVRNKIPNANIFISTTGFNMDKSKWDDVLQYVDTLKLSIYGVTEKTYEAFHRGKVKYNTSMENIEGLLEYSKDKKRPYTIGLYMVTDINQHEETAWIRKWESKLDEVFVWSPHNWVDGRNYRKVYKERQISCGRPFNAPMYIHSDGTVSPCCFDLNKRMVMGDMNTQSIEEIYKGDAYEKLREAHSKGDFSKHICSMCDQTNFNPNVLLYKSDSSREVGQITSNKKDVRK